MSRAASRISRAGCRTIDTPAPRSYIAAITTGPGNDAPSRSVSIEWGLAVSRRYELRFSRKGEHAAFCVALRAPFRWHPDATF
jgi:hypothetical protein